MSGAKTTEPQQHASLAAALAAFQAEVPRVHKENVAVVTPKDGGRSYKYTYADLADVSLKVLPVLGRHGLSFSSKPTLNADGKFVLVYLLRHESGESDGGEYPLGSGTAQQLGSAITYSRRYCLCAITGVVADEDDDGEQAQAPAVDQQAGRNGQQRPPQQRSEPSEQDTPDAARKVVENRAKAMKLEYADLAAEYEKRTGTPLDGETRAEWIRKFIAGLNSGSVKVGDSAPAEASS